MVVFLLLIYFAIPLVDGTDALTWYERGGEYTAKNNLNEAIDAYKNAISENPNYLEAWLALANVYIRGGKPDLAIDAYQHAANISPNNSFSWQSLGYAYITVGQNKEALDAFNHAVALTPSDPLAWLKKGLALSALGDLNGSVSAYQTVIQLSPRNFDAWLCLGLDYYTLNNYSAALDAFTTATGIDERSSLAWRYKGLSLSRLGRYQEAIEAYNRGLIVDPGNTDLVKDKEQAEKSLRSYLGSSGTTNLSTGSPLSDLLFPAAVITVAALLVATVFFVLIRKARAGREKRVQEILPGITSPATSGDEASPGTGTLPQVAHDVFISYSSKDKPIANAVCAHLEFRNIRCWIAPRDVLPGANYPRSIIEGIETSRVMVLVFSSHSNSSPHVIRELTHAVTKGVIIIPFRIEDVPPSKDMEYLIGVPHWLDAMTPPLEQHLTHLVQTVETLLQAIQGHPADK